MKAFLFFVILALTAVTAANGQSTEKHNRDKTVVDSNGMHYPYAIWKKLVETKTYRLKKIDPDSDSSAYLLVKLDSAEVDRRLSRLPKPDESKFFKDDQQISLFTTTDINGYKLKKKELAGKIVVLNFWFRGCSPCRKEFPELNELALKYAGDPNVVFIAVSLDHDADIIPFIKNYPLSYHIVGDGREYADDYGIKAYPTNVVIDKTGKVKFHSSGYNVTTAYWIKKTIEELKSGS